MAGEEGKKTRRVKVKQRKCFQKEGLLIGPSCETRFKPWTWFLGSYVTLSKLLKFSEPQFP